MANLNNLQPFLATMAKLTITDPVTADDNADKSINKYLEQLFSNDTYLKENAVANAWKANTDYAIGDVAYSKNARSYMRFDCISPGKSGANEPNWNAAGVGATVIDGACQWKIHDVKDTLPVGAIIPFPMAAIPAGYLACNGQAVGRATYPELYAAIGTAYGTGDGSTTFNLPDLRGEFIRGWDNGRGVDPGRTLGSGQADLIKMHNHNVWVKVLAAAGGSVYVIDNTAGSGQLANHVIPSSDLGAENRPRNVAMQFCIKAFGATVNPGLVDVTQLANDVAAKVPLADFIGSNQNLATNGWQKLPGGLILQWGEVTTDATGVYNLVFPISFSVACYQVLVSDQSAGGALLQTTWNKSKTGCKILSSSGGADLSSWFAIGK